MVHSLLHVGHCLLIAVENARHHHPFLSVLWFGHMFSRSCSRSWLVISDWKRLCEEDAPRLRSSWMRQRVGVLSWHSNSSCLLLVSLSIVHLCVFRLFSSSIRTARYLFMRALPSSSMRVHCIPSVAWFIRIAGGVLAVSRFCRNISLTICGMLIAHFSPCQPSSMRSSISSLLFSSFFDKGGGRIDITS